MAIRRWRRRAASGLFAVVLAGCAEGPPPDEKLIRNFETHRAEFDSLAALVAADPSLETLPVEASWKGERTPARAELRRRMKRLGLWGLRTHAAGSGSMEFVAGSIRSGRVKSYVRLPYARVDTVSSLDGPRVALSSHRALEGEWYLRVSRGEAD